MDKDVATLQAEAEAKKEAANVALEDARKATVAAQEAVRAADQQARAARYEAEMSAKAAAQFPLRKKLLDVCVSACAALSTEEAEVGLQHAPLDSTTLWWVRMVDPDGHAKVRVDLAPGDTWRHRGSPMAVTVMVGIETRKRYPMRKDGTFSWDKIEASIKDLYVGQVCAAKRAKDAKDDTLGWLSTMEALLGANRVTDIRRTEGYVSARYKQDTEVVGKLNGATIRITRKWGSAILSAEYEVGALPPVDQMKQLVPIIGNLPRMKEVQSEPVADNAS